MLQDAFCIRTLLCFELVLPLYSRNFYSKARTPPTEVLVMNAFDSVVFTDCKISIKNADIKISLS